MTGCACAQDVVTYFSVGPDICTPVKVKTNLGTFYVYDEEKAVGGYVSSIEAWDCQGRKILDLEPDRRQIGTTKPNKYWYIFNTLYPETSSKKSSDYSQEYNNNNFGSGFAKAAQNKAQIQIDGYPNLQLQAGASRLYGEFARLKFCGGGEGGLAVYGGIGKDYLFKGQYDDRLLWHAAIGYYSALDENSDFTFCISYAQTSQLEDKVMGLDCTFSYYFGDSTRFGVFLGGGMGITSPFGYFAGKDTVSTELTWDVNVGIAVKLWNE